MKTIIDFNEFQNTVKEVQQKERADTKIEEKVRQSLLQVAWHHKPQFVSTWHKYTAAAWEIFKGKPDNRKDN